MQWNKKLLITSVLALSVTAGSGVLSMGSLNQAAAAAVEQDSSHPAARGGSHVSANSAEIAALLGLTADELKTARSAGKSLATLASEKGVEVQKLIDLEVKQVYAPTPMIHEPFFSLPSVATPTVLDTVVPAPVVIPPVATMNDDDEPVL